MNLMVQVVEDYRIIERKLGELVSENARLHSELARLEEAAKVRSLGQLDEVRSERDRLKQNNLLLARSAQLWKRRYNDLARE